MGSVSRHRKAEKRRRRRAVPTATVQGPSDGLSVREVIHAAAAASRQPVGAGGRYRELLGWLADGTPAVERELRVVLAEALRGAHGRHWDADEIGRQAERHLGPRHARYVRALSEGDGELARWPSREGLSGLDAVACAVEVLALLVSLPPLPRLEPAARAPQAGDEARVLEKVRALLAKAESTTFPEEAEALSAKAQELMARHSIDAAMVDGGWSVVDDGPSGLRLPVDDPYASSKSILLSEVAAANRCKAVWSKGLGFSTVMGFESDLMFVEMLYTSLLVQATSAMVAAGSQVDRSGRSRTRSFRQAFLLAYATRIGHRLRAAEAAVRSAAGQQYGEALLPVLADRTAAVEDAAAKAFPGAVSRSVTVSNAAGWAAGSAAADLASLSGRTAVPS